MSLLHDRLLLDDVRDLPDWQASHVLNSPDPSLPVRTEWVKTSIGVGTILDVLGPADGSGFLDAVEAAAAGNSVLKWGLRILQSSNLDVSLASTRGALESLRQAGSLTDSQLDALLALSRRQRNPSWSEHHGIEVNARTVGLARGGI